MYTSCFVKIAGFQDSCMITDLSKIPGVNTGALLTMYTAIPTSIYIYLHHNDNYTVEKNESHSKILHQNVTVE